MIDNNNNNNEIHDCSHHHLIITAVFHYIIIIIIIMIDNNKMYNYTIETALDSYKLKDMANESYKKLLENTGNTNENSNL